jgi:hypothetical protein
MCDRLARRAVLGAAAAVLLTLPAGAAERALSHDVFFSLKDASEAAQAKLVAGCEKHLSGHEGTLFFSVGTRVAELQREVNDRDFEVSLHITFKDKAAHDKYQDHPRHKQFIQENQDNWKKVRVFDSYVATGK